MKKSIQTVGPSIISVRFPPSGEFGVLETEEVLWLAVEPSIYVLESGGRGNPLRLALELKHCPVKVNYFANGDIIATAQAIGGDANGIAHWKQTVKSATVDYRFLVNTD